MKTFDLTPKELRAATLFVASCLDGMGGKRPSDLERDEFTWIGLDVLTSAGHSRHEAAGLMSSLSDKGFISVYDRRNGKDEWIVNTSGWQWLDTKWDAIQAEAKRVEIDTALKIEKTLITARGIRISLRNTVDVIDTTFAPNGKSVAEALAKKLATDWKDLNDGDTITFEETETSYFEGDF